MLSILFERLYNNANIDFYYYSYIINLLIVTTK